MSKASQSSFLCLLLFLCRQSCCALTAELPLGSHSNALASHHRSLQQQSGCSNPEWQCNISAGQQMRLSDATHTAVLAGNCAQLSTSLGLWQCGQNLIQGDVIAAVQQDSCAPQCIASQIQLCAALPAPAPAPSQSSLTLAIKLGISLQAGMQAERVLALSTSCTPTGCTHRGSRLP